MTSRFQTILLLIAFLLQAIDASAGKLVAYSGSPLIVKTAIDNPTEVKFQNNEIASIVLGMPAQAISLQNTTDSLFIQPLETGLAGDIFIVMKDGRSRILSIIPTTPEDRDRLLEVVDKDEQLSSRVKNINESGLTPAGLIKAMVLGTDLGGVTINKSGQVILDGPVRLVATTIYDAVYMKGYIVDLSNPDLVDLKNISAKNLLASGIYQGKAYFVFYQ